MSTAPTAIDSLASTLAPAAWEISIALAISAE